MNEGNTKIYPKKNVTVYIDAANLICTSKDVNITYDLEKLLKYFVYKYNANKCIYFTTYFKEFEVEYNLLKGLGVEIVFRELSRSGGKVKTDCDVDIANRITLDVEYKKTEGIVLVTCDGDFGNLLDYVKNKIGNVRLFAVAESKTSKLLKKRQYLEIVYLEEVIELIQKGKGPAIHARVEGTLFDNLSITPAPNLSSHEPSTILKVNEYGIGVYATKDFGVGDYVKLYNKENVLIDVPLFDVPEEYRKFVVLRSDEKCNRPRDLNQVESAWYLNHSSNPNIIEDWDKALYRVLKHIKKGEELFIDYNNFEEPEGRKEEYYKSKKI